ncbi:MAG: tRNA 2-thiouridine(34) synthase MnmA [Candidatus Nomurabacteria bacterium]|jgi:tRNA-specific 2-thiouridylase|nr:tRNA 2-thiouridine(34) synthase MnmA [Candidatus Nomurabacteria bacterium]
MQKNKKTVVLGMSGGVDSSVAAVLLLREGYDVRGVYMKNWSKDLPSMRCPWARDLADAKRTAVRLGLPFEVWDFEEEYRKSVVDYMLTAYADGETPNPDVMCNQMIKFDAFARKAFASGADYIATGHYARVSDNGELMMARDAKKDQTYFLCRVSSDVLRRTLFPVGELLKTEVKEIAASEGLDAINKKESMGVCFVGEANIKEFLREFLPAEAITTGRVVDIDSGEVMGYHDGQLFYTIGQRHGLYLTSDLPYYVVVKNVNDSDIFVTHNLNHPNLWTRELLLKNVHNISGLDLESGKYFIRVRHQAPLVEATFDAVDKKIIFADDQKMVASGQTVAFYSASTDGVCLGGGIVSSDGNSTK